MDDDGEAERTAARQCMVAEQLVARGVDDPRVLDAMRTVPRHLLVPPALIDRAYDDGPLPIEAGQTISQPFVVAVMTARAEITPGARVLEIGTGSGYQTAVLCALGARVWSIEIVVPLAHHAAAALARLGCHPELRIGDGSSGWPEAAPFDAIVVTAAPASIPPALIAQLAPGGRLVIPVGTGHQELLVVRRTEHGTTEERVFPVRFVPMTGAAGAAGTGSGVATS